MKAGRAQDIAEQQAFCFTLKPSSPAPSNRWKRCKVLNQETELLAGLSPEKTLLANVLQQALLDAVCKNKYLRRDALRWFEDCDFGVFGFGFVCENLGYEVKEMLNGVKAWIKKNEK